MFHRTGSDGLVDTRLHWYPVDWSASVRVPCHQLLLTVRRSCSSDSFNKDIQQTGFVVSIAVTNLNAFILGTEQRTHSQWDSLEGLSILYAIGERKLKFQNHYRKSVFFEMQKTSCVWIDVWVGGPVVIKRVL